MLCRGLLRSIWVVGRMIVLSRVLSGVSRRLFRIVMVSLYPPVAKLLLELGSELRRYWGLV